MAIFGENVLGSDNPSTQELRTDITLS
jgi:hypothetical protein